MTNPETHACLLFHRRNVVFTSIALNSSLGNLFLRRRVRLDHAFCMMLTCFERGFAVEAWSSALSKSSSPSSSSSSRFLRFGIAFSDKGDDDAKWENVKLSNSYSRLISFNDFKLDYILYLRTPSYHVPGSISVQYTRLSRARAGFDSPPGSFCSHHRLQF